MKIKLRNIVFAISLICAVVCSSFVFGANAGNHRKVALQCYTFKNFTLEETLKLTKELRFDALEGTPVQKIGGGNDAVLNPLKMDEKDKADLKKLLSDYNAEFVSFGVVSTMSENDIIAYCKFAKEFSIGAILTESPAAALPIWNKYANEYGIKVYLHHHASDSPRNQYFDPYVMSYFVSKYPNIMANPDNGHWGRSGLDSAESFKKLRGKIGSIHIKDIDKADLSGVPVPLGEGALKLKDALAELDAQGYDGYFVIEYERDWDNPLPSVKKCVEFLRNN